MKEEPFFLVNEFLEKERDQIELILDSLSVKNQRRNDKAIFLRNFTNEMFVAYRRTKKVKVAEHKEELDKTKQLLLKKKTELINKLKQLQEKPVVQEAENKEIILSKETGKTLVGTEFNGVTYNVKEPEISLQDQYLLNEVENTAKSINLEDRQKLIDLVKISCVKYNLSYSDEYFDKIRYYVVRDLKKYGKISPLIEDKDVKEIICDGFGKPINITYKDKQDIPTSVQFDTEDELNEFISSLAKKTNQQVSIENPFLNTSLEGLNIQASFGSEFVKAKFLISKA